MFRRRQAHVACLSLSEGLNLHWHPADVLVFGQDHPAPPRHFRYPIGILDLGIVRVDVRVGSDVNTGGPQRGRDDVRAQAAVDPVDPPSGHTLGRAKLGLEPNRFLDVSLSNREIRRQSYGGIPRKKTVRDNGSLKVRGRQNRYDRIDTPDQIDTERSFAPSSRVIGKSRRAIPFSSRSMRSR